MTDIKRLQEFVREKIIMACHPGCTSYEEVLKKEIGFGCEIMAFVGRNKKGEKLPHERCVMTHCVFDNDNKAISQAYKCLQDCSNIDKDCKGDCGESFHTFENHGISKIIGKPLTLDRILKSWERYAFIHDGKTLKLDTNGSIYFQGYGVAMWDFGCSTFEEQTKETQIAIAELLGYKNDSK